MAQFRRWHLAPAAILLLAGLHGGAWLLATRLLQSALDDLARPVDGQPWRIEAGPTRRGGWPLAATLDIAGLNLVNPASRSTIRVTGARLTWSPRHPALARISLAGPISIGSAGMPTIDLTAEQSQADLALTDAHAITLAASGLRITTPSGPVVIDRLDATATPGIATTAADPALDLEARIVGIDLGGLASASTSPLGARITSLALSAALSGPINPSLHGAADIARAWRDGGGHLTVSALDLQWSRLDIDLQATIGLDAALQPEGTGTAGAGGIPETLDRIVGEGLMPASKARAIKAVIGLMTQTPDSKISIPLTLKSQTLSAARFPLLRLPDLRWP